jgi:hypothetical protein
MSEPKTGDSVTFEINGKKLVIEPVPYGNIKQLLKMFMKALEEIGAGKSMTAAPEVIEKYLPQVLPLFFKKGSVEFITQKWIDESMTVAQIKAIVDTAVAVNGLKDFFDPSRKSTVPIIETNTASAGTSSSTIFSGSPTGGSPEK